ncbi:low-complexity protein [Leptolyngbya sp. BL0902]|uniref:pentapeptide repeat-containing protein n=1 Tax=Leptolyngbya sp. BL0902 TaxID=1115757 RepID=UPI0018E84E69|nr:pentapeptide repeat-containing protein [Leptolyngbya sp. BL0902]QQE64569.1 low-complexity protein [Leptolyngbya sp. BL0902]
MTTPSVPVSQIVTAADLVTAYAAGQRNFEYVILADTDLSGADLKGCDFSYADFSAANLSGSNLRGADLSYANLREANLTAADLRGAMLIGTDLRTANITDTQFHQADYDPQETHFPAGFDPIQQAMKADR